MIDGLNCQSQALAYSRKGRVCVTKWSWIDHDDLFGFKSFRVLLTNNSIALSVTESPLYYIHEQLSCCVPAKPSCRQVRLESPSSSWCRWVTTTTTQITFFQYLIMTRYAIIGTRIHAVVVKEGDGASADRHDGDVAESAAVCSGPKDWWCHLVRHTCKEREGLSHAQHTTIHFHLLVVIIIN